MVKNSDSGVFFVFYLIISFSWWIVFGWFGLLNSSINQFNLNLNFFFYVALYSNQTKVFDIKSGHRD